MARIGQTDRQTVLEFPIKITLGKPREYVVVLLRIISIGDIGCCCIVRAHSGAIHLFFSKNAARTKYHTNATTVSEYGTISLPVPTTSVLAAVLVWNQKTKQKMHSTAVLSELGNMRHRSPTR